MIGADALYEGKVRGWLIAVCWFLVAVTPIPLLSSEPLHSLPSSSAADPAVWGEATPLDLVPYSTGGPTPSAIHYPLVKVTGFFQADTGWFSQGRDAREALVDGSPLGDIPDGADFRRTRLAAKGDVADNVGFMIEMDFAFPGRPSFMDVYMDIRNLPGLGTVRIGQWRQPFSMDALTSVKELSFLERALPFALVPLRQVGVGAFHQLFGDRATWAASAFRYPTDVYGGNVGDRGGYGFASRVTCLAWEPNDSVLVHLGGGYSFADPSFDILRYRNQPEFFVNELPGGLVPIGPPSQVPPFVDTGFLTNSKYYSLGGAELAARIGRLSLQSEAMFLSISRSDAERLNFAGVYAQAAYMLTGEVRPYDYKNGVFGRIEPLCPFSRDTGWGAWELSARWSYLDLNDEEIRGNRLTNLTFGVTWYLNRHAKFQLNYIHAMLDSLPDGRSDTGICAARAQLDF